jgi:hypothetical protein
LREYLPQIVTCVLCVQGIYLTHSDSRVRLFNAHQSTEYFRFNFLTAETIDNILWLYNRRKREKVTDFRRQILPPSSGHTFEAVCSAKMAVNIRHSTHSPSKRKVTSIKKTVLFRNPLRNKKRSSQPEQGLFLCTKRLPEQRRTEQQIKEIFLRLNTTAWERGSEVSETRHQMELIAMITPRCTWATEPIWLFR